MRCQDSGRFLGPRMRRRCLLLDKLLASSFEGNAMRSSLAIRCSIMTLPVAVLFLIAGCGDKQMGSPKAETPKTDPVSETPDAVLTPTQLVDEFKKDNKAFLSKYQNKTLEITGKVTE